MNLNNIHEGQEFKNYPALCEALEIDRQKGNSINAQLRTLSLYIKYRKENRKFIIEKIYTEDETRYIQKTRHYSEILELLCLDYLSKQQNGKTFVYRNQLLYILNLINAKYKYYYFHQNQLSNNQSIDVSAIDEFYILSHHSFKYTIDKMLNSLRDKSLIIFTYKTMVEVVKIKDSKKIIIDSCVDKYGDKSKNVKVESDIQKTIRAATTKENQAILQYEREWKKEHGFIEIEHKENKNGKTIEISINKQIVDAGLWANYTLYVKNKLKDNFSIINYFDGIEIVYNTKEIENEFAHQIKKWKLTDSELKENQRVANDVTCNKLIKNAEKRHNISTERYTVLNEKKQKILNSKCVDVENEFAKEFYLEFCTPDVLKDEFRSSDAYMEYNKKLIDILVKRNL